jgi:hypothetical protein
MCFLFSSERKAHVPLPAAAIIAYGFKVVVMGNHLNRTAGSGYVTRLVRFILILKCEPKSFTQPLIIPKID